MISFSPAKLSSRFVRRKSARRIASKIVVFPAPVAPGLYYPEWGGIRLEDLVWLAPSGEARCLTELEDFLEL